MTNNCGNCKYCKRNFNVQDEWCCDYADSDYYGCPTAFDDTCKDFVEKDS